MSTWWCNESIDQPTSSHRIVILPFLCGVVLPFSALVLVDNPFLVPVAMPMFTLLIPATYFFYSPGGQAGSSPAKRLFVFILVSLTIGLIASLFTAPTISAFGARSSHYRPIFTFLKLIWTPLLILAIDRLYENRAAFSSLLRGFFVTMVIVMPYALCDWVLRLGGGTGLPRLGNSAFTEGRQDGAAFGLAGQAIPREAGPAGEPKGFAFLLIFTAIVILLRSEASRVRKAALILIPVLIFSTFSTGGWILVAIAPMVLLAVRGRGASRQFKKLARNLTVGVAALTIIVYTQFEAIADTRLGGQRFDRWDRHVWAIETATARPYGQGLGQSPVLYAESRGDNLLGGPPLIFANFVDSGLLGGFLFIAGVVGFIAAILVMARRSGDTELALLGVMLTLWLVQSFDTIGFDALPALVFGWASARWRHLRAAQAGTNRRLVEIRNPMATI